MCLECGATETPQVAGVCVYLCTSVRACVQKSVCGSNASLKAQSVLECSVTKMLQHCARICVFVYHA